MYQLEAVTTKLLYEFLFNYPNAYERSFLTVYVELKYFEKQLCDINKTWFMNKSTFQLSLSTQ